MPYATHAEPGVRINFEGNFEGTIASQFKDQFAPYLSMAQSGIGQPIDINSEQTESTAATSADTTQLKGTLFRLPLRRKPSDISNRIASIDSIVSLLTRFQKNIHESLIFLKNVHSIEVYVREPEQPSGSLLTEVR